MGKYLGKTGCFSSGKVSSVHSGPGDTEVINWTRQHAAVCMQHLDTFVICYIIQNNLTIITKMRILIQVCLCTVMNNLHLGNSNNYFEKNVVNKFIFSQNLTASQLRLQNTPTAPLQGGGGKIPHSQWVSCI